MVWRVPMSAADATPAEVDPGRGPARGYTWAPFTAGHTVSLKHGAHSPRVVGPLAEQLEAGLNERAPWASAEAFAPTRAAWAWAEAQSAVLRSFLDEHGVLDEDHQPRPAVDLLGRVESRAERLRTELGLTPMALAKLLSSLSNVNPAAAAGGLDALVAAGAAVRERAEAALSAPRITPAAPAAGTDNTEVEQ
jgi:hypothetical protein